jgi:tetratricopeptide (TPR) repeat protein
MKRGLTVLLMTVAAAGPGAAAAQAPEDGSSPSPEARAHYERGARLAQDKDYEAAARAFEAAFQIDPRRDFLFAWAQVERLSGDCDAAIPLYRRFLERRPPEKQAEAAQRLLERCEEIVAARPKPAAPPTARIVVAAPAAPAPPPPPPARIDAFGGVLFGAAAVALAAGGALVVLGNGDAAATRAAATYDAYLDGVQGARQKRLWGGVALGIGGAVLSWALARLALR